MKFRMLLLIFLIVPICGCFDTIPENEYVTTYDVYDLKYEFNHVAFDSKDDEIIVFLTVIDDKYEFIRVEYNKVIAINPIDREIGYCKVRKSHNVLYYEFFVPSEMIKVGE